MTAGKQWIVARALCELVLSLPRARVGTFNRPHGGPADTALRTQTLLRSFRRCGPPLTRQLGLDSAIAHAERRAAEAGLPVAVEAPPAGTQNYSTNLKGSEEKEKGRNCL